MTDAAPATPVPHPGRGVGRAARACALAMVAGLLVIAAGLLVVTLGGAHETQDISWYFALYVLPAVVILTVLLFIAAIALGIVGVLRASGVDRRPAVTGIVVAVAVIVVYVAGAVILGAMLSPHVTG